jgi:CubicO group peptidase (beta-lactamase class C family)
MGLGYVWKALVYNYVDYDDYKLFENREIASGPEEGWPLAKRFGSVKLPPPLEQYLADMHTIAFLAIVNDSLVFEKYWNGHDENTMSNSFSVAKSYITMLTGFALADGHFTSLDDPITKYLPELDPQVFAPITLRHLATMSSGLDWKESYGGVVNHTTESYYGKDLWKLVSGLGPKAQPGTLFHYKGCDPQLLAFALEKATGKTVSAYLSEKFWKPTGAYPSGLWSLDHGDGTEKAYCCLNTTARNFAKIGQLYLHHGRWGNQQLLDSAWVAQSIEPHLIPDKNGKPTQYYGYQWWCMDDLGKDVFYARGLNGQYVICLPKKNTILVRLGEKRESSGNHPPDVMRYVEWAEGL